MKKFTLLFALLLSCSAIMFAQRTISGVVSLKDTGEPEPGVNVIVTGTTTGTITDLDGKYSLIVPSGKFITVSYIGYNSQTIEPKGDVVDVVLEQNAEELEEVVAVGYGTMRKSDVTGSISSVSSDALQKTPASGVDQALQGKAAGVTVNSSSGQPGAPAEIRIRGIGSINGNSAPIYVVDGIVTSDISFLSPSDIATTEILKDASSASIYGSRAANGVILITTKTGEKDRKAKISFNAYGGFQNAWKKLDVMKSKEYAEAVVTYNGTLKEKAAFDKGFNEWLNLYRLGGSAYYPTIESFDYSKQETDWQKEVFRSFAPIQNYSLSIDGAGDKYAYSISASYFNQQGTIKGSDYSRFTIRANSEFQVRKWLKIGENVSYVHAGGRNATVNNASPGASIISAALAMAPWDPAKYPKGAVNAQGDDLSGRIAASSNFKNVTNPYSMIEESNPQNKSERWVGDVFLNITPVQGLTIRSQVSMDLLNVRDKLFQNAYNYSSYDQKEKNYVSSLMSRQLRWAVDNTITYARDIKKHSFSVMVGQSTEQTDYYSISGAGSATLNNFPFLKNATEDRTYATDAVGRMRMLSAFGRVFYSYDKRYLATVNFRADATSKFPNNPWGYFPSASIAWRMSEESWMKPYSHILEMFKIRLGWGMLGNQDIDSDNFSANMFTDGPTFVAYVLGKEPVCTSGATVLKYVNTNGTWETTSQWNVGIDFGFWNGMLSGSIEGYVRDTKDLLLYVTSPAQVGNRYYIMNNVGTMRNAGIDITLEHDNRAGEFHYNISANLSFVKNTLTALNGADPYRTDAYTICDVGLPVNSYWGYNYLGVFKSDQEAKEYLPNDPNYKAGDAKYEDLNHDGKIDDSDKTALGSAFPWLTGGLTFAFDIKGVDCSIFFQGVYGNKIYNALRERTESTGATSILSTTMRDAWSVYNPNGSIPNPVNSVNFNVSSRFVEDGSYLRLKNIQIGYTLPKKITMKAKISRLRFYASANNVLTFTKYSGYDPEVSNHGVDYGNYPQARTFTFGINMDF